MNRYEAIQQMKKENFEKTGVYFPDIIYLKGFKIAVDPLLKTNGYVFKPNILY